MKALKLIVMAAAAAGCLGGQLMAQNIQVRSARGQDADTFVSTALAGKGVSITNAKFSNLPGLIATDQIGIFHANGFYGFTMDSGIVMTTGDINLAPGPNTASGSSIPIEGFYSDQELAPIATSDINGCATLDFDFVGLTNVISFMYSFASEEYPEYVCSQFNDVFAFYVTGPDPETLEERTWNVAIIPETVTDSTPDGIAVAINSVNPGVAGSSGGSGTGCYYNYSGYYNDNADGADGIQYDGYTSKMMAVTNIVPCALYHMHLSVCNVGDNAFDSGVFLEYGSFYSPSTQIGFSRRPADTVRTGCTRRVPLSLAGTAYSNGVCRITFGGTAVLGNDYTVATDGGAEGRRDSALVMEIADDASHYLTFAGIPASFSQPKSIELYIETSVCPDFPDLTVTDTMRLVLVSNPELVVRDTVIEANHLCTQVGVEVEQGTAPYTFRWMPADNLADPAAQQTAAFIREDAVYRVAVADRYGCATDTATVTVDIHTREGIDEAEAEGVRVYPNPAEEQLTVEADEILQAELYTLGGQKVYSVQRAGRQLAIDIRGLAAGSYYLRTVTPAGTVTKTVIIK